MANGSFGLSGFPSATSGGSDTGDSTAFSTKEITVTSANGFSKGDLVYQYQNGISAITSAASPGSARFPVPSQKVVSPNGGSGGGTGGFQYVLANRNNNNPRTMAKLSNGNIVWVYNKATSTTLHRPCFVVTDENNTVVVAETIIEATALPSKDWGPVVCALSGGGFVVAWINSSNNLRYGVYTNTGSVTTAPQNDTGVTVTSSTSINRISIAARPVSGGFVVVVLENTTNIVKHRVFGANGTATYAWTSNNTGVSSSQIPRVAVRSDDTFVVVSANNVANTFVYYLWSATNTAVSNSSFSATISQNLGTDVITLTDDRYVFIVSTSTGFFFRTLTGTTLSGTSIAFIPNTTAATAYVTAAPLSNGGWAVAWLIGSNINTAEQLLTNLVYVNVYNSSGTLVSPTYKGSDSTYTGYPFNQIPGSNILSTHFSVLETAGYIHVLCDGYTPGLVSSMQWSRFSKTTYEIVPFMTASYNASGAYTNALPTGNYAPAFSSVSSAAFYAASTSTQGWLNTQPTAAQFLAASQVLATQTSVDYTLAASLSNGNVVVAWSGYDTNSGVTLYFCKYAIFNGDGRVVLPPTLLGAQVTTSSSPQISIAAMPGGKFSIFYKSLYVLSAAGVVLASIASPTATINDNTPPEIAALPGDRIAIMYVSSAMLYFSVYSENLTLLSGPTQLVAVAPYNFKIASIGSSLIFLFSNTASTFSDRLQEFAETSTNVWTLVQDNSMTVSNATYSRCFGLNSGGVFFTSFSGGSNTFRIQGTNGSLIASTGTSSANQTLPRNPVQTGVTSSGNPVIALLDTSLTSFTVYYQQMANFSLSGFQVAHNSNSGAAFTPALASLCGEKMLLAYVSQVSGQKMVLNFSTFNCGRFQGTETITAGVTASDKIAPLTNSAGFTLIGVATSSAAPGGSGTVQINGSATLNDNYFFASPGQSFDYSNPIKFGAVGSVLGRDVLLQGN